MGMAVDTIKIQTPCMDCKRAMLLTIPLYVVDALWEVWCPECWAKYEDETQLPLPSHIR